MKNNIELKLLEIGFYFSGDVLRECRKKRHMKQKDVAKRLGTHQQTISLHERGVRLPSIEFLILYSTLYDVSLDKIVFGK